MNTSHHRVTGHLVAIPIDTDLGAGETRRIGPRDVTFVTRAPFRAGDPLRFAISLPGPDRMTLDFVCSGSVRSVVREGELLLVDASIEETSVSARTESER